MDLENSNASKCGHDPVVKSTNIDTESSIEEAAMVEKRSEDTNCFAMPTVPHASVSQSQQRTVSTSSGSKPKAKTTDSIFQLPKNESNTSIIDNSSEPTLTSKSKSSKSHKTSKDSSSTPSVPLPYTEPEWGGTPEQDLDYNFEVLKNGKIIDNIPLEKKSFFVFGRLPSCDITLEHPSLSRYHAVLQYSVSPSPSSQSTKEKGWYIYDLDSTHGTWINKRKVFPNTYYRIKVGYVIKFGGSSRLHILQGPSDDQEEESELSVTEMKEQREKQKREAEVLKQMDIEAERQRIEAQQKLLEDRGCGWGIGEDAVEDTNEENPFASLLPENESLYIDDPKKALKGFYEREGCDLPDYQFSESTAGKHKCVLDLPVDGPNGEELMAEAVVSGKRKDAVVACALEACRILDKMGMLRNSKHESRKRKQKNWEDDDFYDSDEDTFLDRTGTIEKKRFFRMKKAGKDEAETYDSLLEKYNGISAQIQDLETQLEKAKAEAEARVSEDVDELDAYMNSIKAGAMDTKTRMRLKAELLKAKAEEQRLRRLVNIARPASLPALQASSTTPKSATLPSADSLSRKLHAQQKLQKKVTTNKPSHQVEFEVKPDDFEEIEEDEESSKNEKGLSKSRTLQDSSKDSRSSRSCAESESTSVKTEKTMKAPSLPTKPVSHKPKVRSTAEVLRSEKEKTVISYEDGDPDYQTWLPPAEQSGDGRTSLNDKLGY